MKKKDIVLGYKITKIQSTKFEFKEIEEEKIKVVFFDNESLRVDMGVQIQVDNEKSIVTIHIETNVVEKETEDSLIKHTGITSFIINGLDEMLNKEDDSYDFPPEFLVQLYSLSHSHARALLASKLSSTVYRDKFFLPIVDPKKVFGLED
ncbi:hypothetical protein [Myroides sp. N17-2]|uniref:hypothetical protein n=1 Tax=Myroides sp. N17-2 TaxID=2030799 RepID=UPI000EFA50B6|nr:hypothetical protein [Myroides sp. N17-2]